MGSPPPHAIAAADKRTDPRRLLIMGQSLPIGRGGEYRSGGPDHREDSNTNGRGQRRPRPDDFGEIGIGVCVVLCVRLLQVHRF